jgi:hypothetical protein
MRRLTRDEARRIARQHAQAAGGPVEMGMNPATRTEDHDAGEAHLKMCAVCLLSGK